MKRNPKFICLEAGVRNKKMIKTHRILIWTLIEKTANAFICICLGRMRVKFRLLSVKTVKGC